MKIKTDFELKREKNKAFVAKEWAEWEKTLSEREKQADETWQFINETWLSRLREAHERLDGMARYCKTLEANCHYMERRLSTLEDLMQCCKVFDQFRSIFYDLEDVKNCMQPPSG
jgi:hypothetical protein